MNPLLPGAADAPLQAVAFRRARWPTVGIGLAACAAGAGFVWFSFDMLDPDWHNETTRLLGRLLEDLPPASRFGVAMLLSAIALAIGGALLWDAVGGTPVILLDESGVTWPSGVVFRRKTPWDKVQWIEGDKLALQLDKKVVSMGYAFIDAPRAEVRAAFARFLQTFAGRDIADARRTSTL